MHFIVKKEGFDAARPVVLIPEKNANEMNLHAGDRVEIKKEKLRIIAVADVVDGMIEPGKISLSDDIISSLKIRAGEKVEVNLFLTPKSTLAIAKKLNGKKLSREEIHGVIEDIVSNALSEAEIAYFVSGVYDHGMTLQENIWLTEAMYKTGKVLTWGGAKHVADKHSIGGIAGNRTTPIVVSICASAGVIMPKTSSRAITSASGTADVIETIAHVDFSAEELQKIVKKAGACLAWGGSLGLAPADDKLIRVERLLNVDPESQLIASILAKKLAVGSKQVLIDIPYGPQAKVSKKEGEELKERFMKVGKAFGLDLHILLTEANEPIGNGMGPILEMIDVLKVLKRENGPMDVEKKAVMLAGVILELTKRAKKGEGKELAQRILDTKKAWNKFDQIITLQKKKNFKLTPAKNRITINSPKNGIIWKVDNKGVNTACRILGCPVDKGAGMYIYKHMGERVKKGEPIATLYAESAMKLKEGKAYFDKEKVIVVN